MAKESEKIFRSTCRMCHGVCGVLVHVQRGRVVKVTGDRSRPSSNGYICPKATASVEYIYHSQRLRHPLKRVGERGENRWQRARCGKGEGVHGILKGDLAGGHLPSGSFGANAAWWGITVLAFNLNSLMKRLVLPEGWASKRLKAIRFGFINLAGRVVSRARQLIIRLRGRHPAYELLLEVRQRLRALWTENIEVAVIPRAP